jgi:serine/threonine-protein kinase RsbW
MSAARVMEPITLPASLLSLDQVTRYVSSLAEQGGLTLDASYRLRLATEEIITNVIVHGYNAGPGTISVLGGVDSGRVWVRVADQAPRFDPRTVPSGPQPGSPVQRMRLGGLGIYLARKAVDEFCYEFADGSNVSTLVISSSGTNGGG